MRRGLASILAACVVLAHAPSWAADEPASDKDEARTRFERGIGLYRQKQLDAALAEFLLSRKLYPTRAASFNTARVYKELARYDEALETLETIPKQFPDLTAQDRDELDRELREVKGHIGFVTVTPSEPDATIIIDGRERPGAAKKPVALSAGTHVVRVHKDGFVPFESRVEIAVQATVPVPAKLGALTRGGRLAVSEDRGGTLEVVVDGVAVGKTPWEGTVPVGAHAVMLRGDGRIGSPPTPVDVRLNQLTKLSLVAEPLHCSLRVEPTPRTARVAVDGVELGRGVWEGALRCGGHLVEIGSEGFVSRSKNVSLVEGPTLLAKETLDRDPSSPVWRSKNPPKITIEGATAFLLSPGYGGTLADSCGDGCSASPGLGGSAVARVGYRLGIGIGASLDAGALYTTQSLSGRATETRPYGLPPHGGRADDTPRLSGPMFGASVSYSFEGLPIVLRLGGGVLVGSFADTRSGTFATPSGASYSLPESRQSSSSALLYIDPEVRWGVRLFRGATLDLGVRGLAIAPLEGAPRWTDETELSLGQCPSPDRQICSGRGVYAPSDLAAGLMLFFGPTIGVRGEL